MRPLFLGIIIGAGRLAGPGPHPVPVGANHSPAAILVPPEAPSLPMSTAAVDDPTRDRILVLPPSGAPLPNEEAAPRFRPSGTCGCGC